MSNRLIYGNRVFESHDSLSVGDYGGAGAVGEANIRHLEKTLGAVEVFESKVHRLGDFLGKDELAQLNAALDKGVGQREDGLAEGHPDCLKHRGLPALYSNDSFNPREGLDSGDLVVGMGLSDGFEVGALEEAAKHSVVVLRGGMGFRQAFICPEEAPEYIASLSDYPALDDQLVSEVTDEWERQAFFDGWQKKELVGKIRDEELEEKADELDDEVLWSLYKEVQGEQDYPKISVQYSDVHIHVDEIAEAFEAKVRAHIENQPKP